MVEQMVGGIGDVRACFKDFRNDNPLTDIFCLAAQ